MCTLSLPKSAIRQIDKFRKHCLWRGADINNKKTPKVAWDMVCLPKDEGGLGVIKLQTQNEALLLKLLHKFFNRDDIPWVHLVWEKTLPQWEASWSGQKGIILVERYPKTS